MRKEYTSPIKEERDRLEDILRDREDFDGFNLRFIQEGFVEAIELIMYIENIIVTITLWNSENDTREYNEDSNEYELLETFINRKLLAVKSSIDNLSKLIS